MVEKLCNTAAIQTELGGAKFGNLNDWHLLTKSLLDLKHRALDASSKLMCWDRVISQRAVFNPLIYCL